MLRIDLLPRHFAIARTNKVVIALSVIVLILVMLGWAGAVMLVKGQIAHTQDELAKIEPIAKQVEEIEAQISKKQADLAPIKAKVEFVQAADQSGAQYWDRFHAIAAWIPAFARITRFSITGQTQVNFDAIVGDTTEAARFVMNIIQSPALQNISISGLPTGVSIEGAGGAAAFSPMGGPEIGMAPPPPPMPTPGMAPGATPGGGTTATGEIQLSITATLTEPVSEPAPPGGGQAPAGGAGGVPGGELPGVPPEPGGGEVPPPPV